MSAKYSPEKKDGVASSNPSDGSVSLINPTVRRYMDTTNLERFYGGYVIDPLKEGVYNLGIGEVGDIPLSRQPFDIYREFIQSDELSRLVLRYSGTHGERETNHLMADGLNRWLGVERFHDGVVVSTDGGQNAADIAVRTFTSPLGSAESPKQYVLTAAPLYPYLSAIITSHAGLQSFLAYDGESLTDGIERYTNAAVGLILINVPKIPLVYGISAEQAQRINRVARHYDCAIMVDIVYANYSRDGALGPALAQLDPERTIFADSFSKKYGYPGLRIGFAISAAERLTYAMRFMKMSESLTPSNVKLAFAGHLLSNYPDYPAEIAREVMQRHERFLEAAGSPEHIGVKFYTGRANPFYLAADVSELVRRCGLTEAQIAEFLLQRFNVKVFPGQFIYPHAALEHAVFSDVGIPANRGGPPYDPPKYPAGAQIVYAQDYFSGRAPLLRLSFGMETRVEEAAAALLKGLEAVWNGAAEEMKQAVVQTQIV